MRTVRRGCDVALADHPWPVPTWRPVEVTNLFDGTLSAG
ncbi:hypothetical protein DVS28_a1126 [Euzebya pacifica]|uniref:Uncharacterized protein n=1 Tax=Euzebya pacifica TaxID=1608957 RepID=A0A346XUC9_9ACTN|nr:hypothetical protein DVS28_a1126 [Euzebya pacifica]